MPDDVCRPFVHEEHILETYGKCTKSGCVGAAQMATTEGEWRFWGRDTTAGRAYAIAGYEVSGPAAQGAAGAKVKVNLKEGNSSITGLSGSLTLARAEGLVGFRVGRLTVKASYGFDAGVSVGGKFSSSMKSGKSSWKLSAHQSLGLSGGLNISWGSVSASL